LLDALMARTLGNNHSNVERLQVAIEPDGTLRQKGRIDAAIDLPFQSKGQVSVTADGRLRVSTPTSPRRDTYARGAEAALRMGDRPDRVIVTVGRASGVERCQAGARRA
jgi:hypothetical protein